MEQQYLALNRLDRLLGRAGWIDQATAMQPYLNERRGHFHGEVMGVARPRDSGQLVDIVTVAGEYGLGVIAQGGNTGLCGGAAPSGMKPEIIVSLERMNRILASEPLDDVIVAEAGCTLAQVQQAAERIGRCFPITYAVREECTIGGNIATNAGGMNTIRYGNTRRWVLGLEVVLADGSLWNNLKYLHKDNSNYALQELFIGTEGTLGIVTKAALRLAAKPGRVYTAMLAVPDIGAAVKGLCHLRRVSGDRIITCELLSRACVEIVRRHMPDAVMPLWMDAPWYLLLEIETGRDETILDECLASGIESRWLLDWKKGGDDEIRRQWWKIRNSIPSIQKMEGASIKHDLSVPISRMDQLVTQGCTAMKAICPDVRPMIFGHLGDGNLHFNLSQPPDMAPERFLSMWDECSERMHDLVMMLGGSIAAEHGIGQLKRRELQRTQSPLTLRLMRAVKNALDPEDILNPGKVVPPAPGQAVRSVSSLIGVDGASENQGETDGSK